MMWESGPHLPRGASGHPMVTRAVTTVLKITHRYLSRLIVVAVSVSCVNKRQKLRLRSRSSLRVSLAR